MSIDISSTLPAEFLRRMKAELGDDDYASFLLSFNSPATRGFRVNTLKASADFLLSRLEFPAVSLKELDSSYDAACFKLTADARGIGNSPYHSAGAFYVQEPSAMSVVCELENVMGATLDKDIIAVDFCAAPGGKTLALASKMRGKGVLVANEPVQSRAKELFSNIERAGITNAIVTCAEPGKISAALCAMADVAIVDAPCSGEGMFRKNPLAAAEWSKEHVLACSRRQRLITASASVCLRKNAFLAYSTCTFSREENEEVAGSLNSFSIMLSRRLYPHSSQGEGHYVSILQNKAEEGASPSKTKATYLPCNAREFLEFEEAALASRFTENTPYMRENGAVFYASKQLLMVLSLLQQHRVRVLSAGIPAGSIEKNRFEPSHTLFMASGGSFRQQVELNTDSGNDYSTYYGGNVLDRAEFQAMRGYCLVCYDGLPVGFGKISEGIMKNKLPKALRK